MIGVVKIGGAEGNKLEPLLREISSRVQHGEKWVLVHGASGIMDKFCRERNMEIRMITSPAGYRSRFVGLAERAVFEEAAMTYGATIREGLEALGAKSEQIPPAAFPTVFAKRKDILRENKDGRVRVLRGNYSGTVTSVEGGVILEKVENGVTPIMPPLGFDKDSELAINIDGDRLAAATAAALRADVMIILSNVPGLMKDVGNAASLIKNGNTADWDRLEHYAQGNMKRKMIACREALNARVPKVFLADGRVENPITNALEGNSTCLVH